MKKNRLLTVGSIFFALLFAVISSFTLATFFDQWRSLCDSKLPRIDIIKEQSPSSLPTCLTLKAAQDMVDTFIDVMSSEYKKSHNWLSVPSYSIDDYNLVSKLLKSTEDSLFPFVQKQIFNNPITIYACSDIHGDIHAFNAFIGSLVKDGVFDGDLNIIGSNMLVIGGDNVDGGMHGLETLLLAMRLKVKNPKNVILIRGNHETKYTNEDASKKAQYYPFSRELDAKYEGVKGLKNLKKSIYKAYNFMPIAAYVGMKNNDGDVDYALYAHASIEIGFNHLFLLTDTRGACYSFIPRNMKRQKVLDDLFNSTLKGKMSTADRQELIEKCGWNDLDKSTWKSITQIGFSYGDLITKDTPIALFFSPYKNSKTGADVFFISALGKDLMQGIMSYWNNISKQIQDRQKQQGKALSAHYVRMFIRGHQHVPFVTTSTGNKLPNPLFKQLIKQDGVATLWQPATATGNKVWDGEVVSLWSSPNHRLFSEFEDLKWKYQSAAKLVMKPNFDNWRLYNYNTPNF